MAKHSFPFELEHDIRRQFTGPADRVVSAIIAARRVANSREFYIGQHLAAAFGLDPKQMNRGLDRLEGRLIHTVETRRGRYRRMVLRPDYEVEA